MEITLKNSPSAPISRHTHHHHHHHHHHHNISASDEELGVETNINNTILHEHNNDFNELNHNHDTMLVNQTFNNAFVISPYVKMDYRLTNDFTINFEANYEKKFNNILKYTHYESKKALSRYKSDNEKFGVKIGLKYTF